MSQSQEEFDEYVGAFLARGKALIAELDRDYGALCTKIHLHEDSMSPTEWATMVGAKAQLIVARIQVLEDLHVRLKRDPIAKSMVRKIAEEEVAKRK